MFKRKIMQKLLAWKEEKNKPCLLIKGARQVGKTFIVEQFAKENYENYIYINFELMPSMKDIFAGDLDFGTLKLNLEVNFPNTKIEKGKTFLFLDEIGACPNARTALKTFAIDGTIDVIASGSLLSLYYKDVSSYPVGYERPIELYPLDFEEFLWAMGVSAEVIGAAHTSFIEKSTLPSAISDKMFELFKMYIILGGMPAVLNSYLRNNSLNDARETQRALIDNYKNDVLKYASTPDKQKILKTFDSIPVQLAKKNKKFMWSDIDSSDVASSERKYGSALAWLKDAGIVNFCYNLSEPAAPLDANRQLSSYKVYMRDTGLLVSMLEAGATKEILKGDDMINEGGITENVVASELASHGHDLTYFEKRGSLEIDFVLNLDGVVTAMEVKSGKHTQAKSLNSIIDNYKTVNRYIKLEKDTTPFENSDKIEYYPLFMGMFL
ncbi:ATP-binding protein [Candidatus Saccharibacteria bacterium]|nr:ATP-binding protein [Candidatus Saccharibacteria bacterium]